MIAFLFPGHESLNLSVLIISCEYINLFFFCHENQAFLACTNTKPQESCELAQTLEGASWSTTNTWKKVLGMRLDGL